MNIAKSAFTGGVVGWVYGGLPAFYQARRAFIEGSQGELFQNRADAVVRARPGEGAVGKRPGLPPGAGGEASPSPAQAPVGRWKVAFGARSLWWLREPSGGA